MVELSVSKEFSLMPGYVSSKVNYSKELFYENYLYPRFKEAIENNTQLVIDLDGPIGYESTFLRYNFSELKKHYDLKTLMSTLIIITENQQILRAEILDSITDSVEELKNEIFLPEFEQALSEDRKYEFNISGKYAHNQEFLENFLLDVSMLYGSGMLFRNLDIVSKSSQLKPKIIKKNVRSKIKTNKF